MDDYIKVLLLVGSRLEQAGIAYMLSFWAYLEHWARDLRIEPLLEKVKP